MIELNLQQGSDEWRAERAKYKTASEASAMMGVSKYQSRADLLKQKATGIVPDVDAATQARFDAGHEAEAKARIIAERIIGEELFPIVAIDDSQTYLASSDGSTMLLDTGWEHKLLNASLVESVQAGSVPESHKWQLVHQCLVFGFERIMFAVSDGTEENHHYCWFSPTQDDINRLIAGWQQFDLDLAEFKPEMEAVKVTGKTPETLPALRIEVTGMVTASNLDAFKSHALMVIGSVNTNLQSDQDFADAEQAVKWCKDVEDRLDAAKQHALSQTASIDELFRAIDAIKDEARSKRLMLDKLVKAEKENRKQEIVQDAHRKFGAHLVTLVERVGISMAHMISPNFAEAIKGLKSLSSMKDKVSVALANAKVEANAIADRVEANRKTVEDMSLFPDFAAVCFKPADDFAALLAMRITQRQQAEAKRIEAERERIRAEELAKVAKAAQEAEADRKRQEQAQAQKTVAEPDQKPAASNVDAEQTMKLGEICALLGFTVTADFLASLGVHPVGQERAAKLYPASKFQTICRLISDHVLSLAFKKAA